MEEKKINNEKLTPKKKYSEKEKPNLTRAETTAILRMQIRTACKKLCDDPKIRQIIHCGRDVNDDAKEKQRCGFFSGITSVAHKMFGCSCANTKKINYKIEFAVPEGSLTKENIRLCEKLIISILKDKGLLGEGLHLEIEAKCNVAPPKIRIHLHNNN